MINTLKLVAILGVMFFLSAWTRPEFPSKAVPVVAPEKQLDSFEIEVNGKSRTVRPEDELRIIRGDTIKVVSAKLKSSEQEIDLVNVVGYKNSGGKPGEDRGYEVNTGSSLLNNWSEKGDGSVFAIIAETMGEMHGAIYMILDEPVLEYAEILLNGEKHKINSGTELKVRASDSIKVISVVTNVENNDGVRFSIVDSENAEIDNKNIVALESYEIRFVRSGFVFAKIPMQVEK